MRNKHQKRLHLYSPHGTFAPVCFFNMKHENRCKLKHLTTARYRTQPELCSLSGFIMGISSFLIFFKATSSRSESVIIMGIQLGLTS